MPRKSAATDSFTAACFCSAMACMNWFWLLTSSCSNADTGDEVSGWDGRFWAIAKVALSKTADSVGMIRIIVSGMILLRDLVSSWGEESTAGTTEVTGKHGGTKSSNLARRV